ncbi:MAG: hypothetical protein FJ308_24485, partial [Planctomycetes bacterium]|nr:hypothetical protein [Planctomycetota bacterium]
MHFFELGLSIVAVVGTTALAAVILTKRIIKRRRQSSSKPYKEGIHCVLHYLRDHDTFALPTAVVDLDAFDANVAAMVSVAIAAGKSIRVATKSVRCLPLIDRIITAVPPDRFAGLMAFTAKEALALATTQKYAHIMIAYPVGDTFSAQLIVQANQIAPGKVSVAAMVDCAAHIALLGTAARKAGVVLPVWIDIDMSLRLAGQHLGVRRSPLREI